MTSFWTSPKSETQISWRSPSSRSKRPGEEPHMRDALAGRGALDLEGAARDRRVRIGARIVKELGNPGQQLVDADPVGRRTEEHGMNYGSTGLDRQLLGKSS